MPDRDPLTGVPPSRHPFQFWALAACVLSGAAAAFSFGQPRTLIDIMPDFMVSIWGWSLMIGGLLGLLGGWWKDRITGLLLERIALGTIGASCAVYGSVLFYVAGSTGTVAAVFCISIAVASVWRIVHVNRELKILTRWIERYL